MEMTKQEMTSTVSCTANTNTLIAQLGHDDVLLGRGTGPNEHGGNTRFRNMAKHFLLLKLKETKRTNQSCSTAAVQLLSAKDKIELAKKLVAKVHSKKGRFVRKLTKEEFQQVVVTFRNKKTRSSSSSFDSSTVKVLYVVVPENVAVGKAKQSFRHQLRLIAEGNVQDEDEEGNSVVLEDDNEESEIGDNVTPPAGGSSSNKGSRASDEDSGVQRQEEESNFQPAADSISASSTTTRSIPSSAGAARLPESHFAGSLNYPPPPLPHDSSRAIAELSAYLRLPPYNNNNHNRLLNVPLPLMRLLMRTPRPAPLLGYNSSLFLPPPVVGTTASNSSTITMLAGRLYVPTRTNHFLRNSASSSSSGPTTTRQQQQQRVLDPSYDDINNNNNNANNAEGNVHHIISSSPPSPRDSSFVVPSSSTNSSTTTSRSSSSSGGT